MLGPCRHIDRFGGDIGRFGSGWSEMEQDLHGADPCRVNLTREVPVLNPRVERNSVLRENNTVFFPRDAPS